MDTHRQKLYLRLSEEKRLALLEHVDWTPDNKLVTEFQSIMYAVLSYGDVPYELIIKVMAQAREHCKDASASADVDKIQQIKINLRDFLYYFEIDNDTINTDLDKVSISPNVNLPLCSMDKLSIINDAKWGGAATFLSGIAVELPAAAAGAAAAPPVIKVVLDKILECNMELSLGVFRYLKCSEMLLVSHLYWIVQNEVNCTPVGESPHLTDAIEFLRRAGLMP
jgi:hypothetical protein